MFWLVIIGLSFCTGLLRVPLWTILVWPAVSLGVGVWAVATEPANYDAPGFGYYFGGFFAVLCLAAWLLGRGLATLVRYGRDHLS